MNQQREVIYDLRLFALEGGEDLKGEIGALLSGGISGRESADQITIYRSLGIAAQDLAAAHHVLERARAEGRGQTVRL